MGGGKEKSYLGGIPIAWTRGGSLRIETSSYEGEIQAARRGFDTARFLESTLGEILF